MARNENRSRSELLGEALRFYVEAKDVRRTAMRRRLVDVLDRVQKRTQGVSARQIRKVIRESLEAVGQEKRRATASGDTNSLASTSAGLTRNFSPVCDSGSATGLIHISPPVAGRHVVSTWKTAP